MYIRLPGILCFLFLFNWSQAQPSDNKPHRFDRVNTLQLFNVQLDKESTVEPADKQLSIFVFLSPECPLCQNYTKALKELKTQYGNNVNIYGIVPGKAYTADDVRAFESKYKTGIDLFIDTKLLVTNYLQAVATPQAILLDRKNNLVYTGAIDDWVQAVGKKRLHVSRHYLQDAIAESLRSVTVTTPKTKAFGCRINDY